MTTNLSLFTDELQEKDKEKPKGLVKFSFVLDRQSAEIVKKNKLTQPYQHFGVWIAQALNEYSHIPLYIKLAKFQDKGLLEKAVSYVKDYPSAKSKHKLFLWYLKGKLKKLPVKPKVTKPKELKLFNK